VTSGMINYDYASISEGVNHMRQINGNIRDQVSNLRKQVQQMRGEFTGAAAESYETCSQKIAQDLTKSNEQLDTLAGKVNSGSERMGDQDKSQSRRFGNG
jgi:WXG100 family type VII secretion target